MAFPGPTSSCALQKRLAFRLFRIAPSIAVIMAVAAVILVIQGKADGRVITLIAAALGIGLFVLIGYAAMTASQLKKDKDDPRS